MQFRDMYLKLLLNFNLYKNAIEANDNDYYNLEYLFGIVHSVYEWDPRCTLKKTYILKNIFIQESVLCIFMSIFVFTLLINIDKI